MHTLVSKSDLAQLPADIPDVLMSQMSEVLNLLDRHYGTERTIGNDGGCVLYVPDSPDDINCKIAEIKEFNPDIDNAVPEYVDIIKTPDGDFLNALYLFNNEFSMTLIIPKCIAPDWLLRELEG